MYVAVNVDPLLFVTHESCVPLYDAFTRSAGAGTLGVSVNVMVFPTRRIPVFPASDVIELMLGGKPEPLPRANVVFEAVFPALSVNEIVIGRSPATSLLVATYELVNDPLPLPFTGIEFPLMVTIGLVIDLFVTNETLMVSPAFKNELLVLFEEMVSAVKNGDWPSVTEIGTEIKLELSLMLAVELAIVRPPVASPGNVPPSNVSVMAFVPDPLKLTIFLPESTPVKFV